MYDQFHQQHRKQKEVGISVSELVTSLNARAVHIQGHTIIRTDSDHTVVEPTKISQTISKKEYCQLIIKATSNNHENQRQSMHRHQIKESENLNHPYPIRHDLRTQGIPEDR